MSAEGYIMVQNRKVNAYFDKNFMLLKKSFTSFSLTELSTPLRNEDYPMVYAASKTLHCRKWMTLS